MTHTHIWSWYGHAGVLDDLILCGFRCTFSCMCQYSLCHVMDIGTCDIVHWSAAPHNRIDNRIGFWVYVVLGWMSSGTPVTISWIELLYFIMIFIMIVVTITGIFMAINYLLIYTLGFLYISNSGYANAQLPGRFSPGHSHWILDWTCFLWTPLCHVCIPYKDILQGSSRLCNWLSLRRLVPWINHLPPVSWSIFGNRV